MKTRDPRTNPQPSDRLQFKSWTITVTARWPGVIEYSATKPGSQPKNGRQSLDEWRGWSDGAAVPEDTVYDAQCWASANVAGPCEVDGEPIVGHAHFFDGKLRCSQHCPAQHRAARKKAHVQAVS